ncbi:hypothetical protein IM538_06855 [Cytobacillus suaedae]|nr:hypothetical protein IM538_06855 [Cytobacillus suaedae]
MLKKLLKMFLKQQLSKTKHHKYSSSDYKKMKHFGNPSKYGHQYYKKKGKFKFSSFSS